MATRQVVLEHAEVLLACRLHLGLPEWWRMRVEVVPALNDSGPDTVRVVGEESLQEFREGGSGDDKDDALRDLAAGAN